LLLAALLGIGLFASRGYWVPEPVSICFNGQTAVKVSDIIPFSFKNLDIVFAFDQTGSMSNMIDGAKRKALKLMKSVGARLGSQYFSVAGFSDYSDMPYALYQPLTGDYQIVQAAIQRLTLYDGDDAPEDYSRLMYESYSDPLFGWREDSTRYLIIFGDSIPHDPDPGRDGILGTADDLKLSDVLARLAANKITVLYVADPGVSGDAVLIRSWIDWLTPEGGRAISCFKP
jgi:hypothetical protein